MSQMLCKDVLKCEISASPLTDHCLISLFETVKNNIKTLNEEDEKILEEDLTISEMTEIHFFS